MLTVAQNQIPAMEARLQVSGNQGLDIEQNGADSSPLMPSLEQSGDSNLQTIAGVIDQADIQRL